MVAPLPDPFYLGLPEKFSSWRPGQAEAVCHILDSRKRFRVLNAPTGFGKTPTYVGAAMLGSHRTAFLTSSKGLQSQLMEDFQSSGLVDIRGQQNYLCRALLPSGIYYGQGIRPGDRCDAGPCHAGAPCSARRVGCDYFDAVKRAKDSPLVSTNYTYWVHQHRYSEGLGRFDMLVLDEAHDAPDELAQALEIELSDYDVHTACGGQLPEGEDPDTWKKWALELAPALNGYVEAMERDIRAMVDQGDSIPHATMREIAFKRNVAGKLSVLATMEGPWIIERRPKSVKAAPVWPAPYAERFLFLDIPHVVLVSATVKEKTLELLGIGSDDFEYHEYRSSFPTSRRPIRHVPTVRAQFNWSDVEQRTWVRRMDQLIARRLDRKGIIHTTSYEKRSLILTHTEHRAIMLFNDGSNTRQIVEKFRKASAPCVLVSPSLTTGWDLPYEDCEYAIIAKIPFPDHRSKITKARDKADEDYGGYCAMQTIVQTAGRGMRSADDQCEILIVDDHWLWFWKKYQKFAPRWFAQAVDRAWRIALPEPLPKLTKQQQRQGD